jgi:hypothetical protein
MDSRRNHPSRASGHARGSATDRRAIPDCPGRLRVATSLMLFLVAAGGPARGADEWLFDAEVLDGVTLVGDVEPATAGPRRPDYPGFPTTNRAVRLGGAGARIEFADPGPASRFDFGNGDAITIEAWVKPDGIRPGENAYIVGKGRTDPSSATPNNQNWALRLREMGGRACPSFLFATPGAGAAVAWRRWTATSGLRPDDRWHHMAVCYEFGKPESIRAVVDGRPVKGQWDMAGASAEPPVVDDAPVWIGSSMGGNPGSSFRGLLDDVRISRGLVPENDLVGRFVTTLPPLPEPSLAEVGPSPNAGNDVAAPAPKPKAVIPERPALAPIDWAAVKGDRVTVEVCDDWNPAANSWPETPLAATETHDAPAFAFFRLPHRYVDTGVRGGRSDPFLVRAYGKVRLPAGSHRLLLRARGASVLFVDGEPLLRTPFPPPGSDDKPVKVQDGYLDLGAGFRFAPPGNRDAWCEFDSPGGEHEIVLETVVGHVIGAKSKRRPELGETVVAWSPANSSRWLLAAPGGDPPSYDDAGWEAFAAGEERRLAAIDAAARAAARARHEPYWAKRRQHAAEWLAATPEVPVPPLPAGFPAANPVDHFLAERIVAYRGQTVAATAGAAGGIDFWEKIHPVLEARCLECHQGGKAKGGLHLDSLAAAVAGGDSGEPAIVAGSPEKSPLVARMRSADADERMPPKGGGLAAAEIDLIERWIAQGAVWPEFRPVPTDLTPAADDLAFLRRLTLDIVGLVPSPAEIRGFLADPAEERRGRAIDRLLADPRAADHWMGYWQDVLAENPNILNPTLNNTGPFRWWIHESLLDAKPLDLMVTELVRQGGSAKDGGPAGFAVASQNDVPAAAKATILTTAFLGVETKCARCHDSPAHTSKQADVFSIAALLSGKGVKVPATSSVSLAKLREGGRTPLIDVTLEPGTTVEPQWPFAGFVPDSVADAIAEDPTDTRDRLAALVTAPENERFSLVMANRIWARLMGRGLVELPWDWERSQSSHPALLRWLGRELVRSGYDARHVARLVLSSHAYGRTADPRLARPSPLFTAPARRRLAAEQVVDAAFAAVGKPFRTEDACLDIDSIRETDNSLDLGRPSRAWMLTSTSNERDRPSLALPRIQAVCDVLAAFGWRATRPDPLTDRDTAANPLQPAILGNGTMGLWLTRLSDDHAVTRLALEAASPEAFVDELFLRVLTRAPRPEERARHVSLLAPGFADRLSGSPAAPPAGPVAPRRPPYYVSWSNHLDADATTVRQAEEAEARRGDPPTPRLADDWRRRAEDALWSLVTSPEFLFTP